MSRVFLAEDIGLKRAVVIKVLHPELAVGVSADRFHREVQLSARLQHPHIIPVLAAGEIAGLPYYVMPFVKGDTLRARLAAGPLTIGEAVGIFSDVAKALAFAQTEGIVHRDIKPENILLSGGAATVADFGIAKALSSARQQDATGGLTSVGTSLGTPAYMAPEQVAGDPDADHRADIYSLGCVAYEMLTGAAPFAGKSPQQMLAAHVMEPPAPIAERRDDVPPMLAALVMRCLEKEPARRPQSASEIVTELDTTGGREIVGTPARRRARRVTWIVAGVAAVIAALAVPAIRMLYHPVQLSTALNVAVAPFEVLDPGLALWKEGIVDVLSRNLDGAGPIRSVSPGVTIKKWEGHAERTAAVAFGRKVGAQLVIYGQLQSAGRDLVDAKLWVVDAERDVPAVEVEVRDSVSRMDRVTDSLSLRTLVAIGKLRTIGAAQLASLGSSSLPAIRAFLQGAQYFRRMQWDSATAALRQAVAADSTFGIAYAMLGEAYGWTGEAGNDLEWQAFDRAATLIRPGLSPHDSLTLVAVRHYSVAMKSRATRATDLRQAYAAAAQVTERYPDDAAAWYLYADMRLHNDRDLTEREALSNFDHAIRADSDFAPAYIHAIELAYRNGPAVGRRYAAAYLTRKVSAVEETAVRLTVRMADGELRGDALRAVLDTVSPSVAGRAFNFLRLNPDSGEASMEIIRAAVKRIPGRAGAQYKRVLGQHLAFRGHVSEAWRLSVESVDYTAAQLAILGLVPADSAVKAMRPWIDRRDDASFYVLPALAAARDTATLNRLALGAEKVMKTDTSARRRASIAYFVQTARAYSVLASGDSSAAASLFEAVSDTMFTLTVDQFIKARLVARTDPKRALTLLERMTSQGDLISSARQLERGRLAERIGDKERAVDAFGYVASVWRNTDAQPLKDAVKEANAALERLDSDGKVRAVLTVERRP